MNHVAGLQLLLARQEAGHDDEDERGDENDRRDSVDLGRDAAPDRGKDVNRQRCFRARHKERNDEVIERKREGEQKPGKDGWSDLRKYNLAERCQRGRVKVARCLDDVPAEACEARPHDHRHQSHGEQPMRRDDRAVPEAKLRWIGPGPDGGDRGIQKREQFHKRHQRRDADDDARYDDGSGKQPVEDGSCPLTEAL